MALDITGLKAVADTLVAKDASLLSTLKDVKNQNIQLAAQLAALQPDPANQAAIDAITAELTSTAADIDTALAPSPAPTTAAVSGTDTAATGSAGAANAAAGVQTG